MSEYKTPGVYIKEKNAFGNSVVEAETAIPVFIGLTEKAQNGTESLKNKPVRISSMTEYKQYFGKHSVNHVFSSPTSIINFTSKKPSYDDTRRSGRDNELLQRAQNDL